MRSFAACATIALALLAGGCTATMRAAPVEVTRYHLGQPVAAGSVAIEPQSGSAGLSPEYQTYADAVAAELRTLGFAPAAAGDPGSAYIAGVSFVRTPRGMIAERPPVTIGLGGGSYGSGVGVGGGVSFGVGGHNRTVLASELAVQLRRRADDTVVWEGRAQTESIEGREGAQPRDAAARLAHALFRGFPGESGVTITVK